ncbi:MAG: transporter substrate-binding domain-containing protein, partial [Eubacteriales bacterium]|nr:transporter substrate-binding domain-containing protein [Eubacteriales bacterium]
IGVIFSLIGCSNQNEPADTSAKTEGVVDEASDTSAKTKSAVDKIKERGYITIGTSPDCPPSEFIIIEDGKEKIVGSDIAIAEEIAKDLGVELRINTMAFDGLLLELDLGNIDLVLASLVPTEERAKAVDFSDIYSTGEQAIMIKEENINLFKTLDDFSGKKIGVQLTSIQEAIAYEQLPNASITSLNNISNIIMDLNSGNIDGCIVPKDIAELYIKQYPTLAIANVEIQYDEKGSAVAIKKGNSDLVEQVNKTIARLKEAGLIEQFKKDAYELLSKQ